MNVTGATSADATTPAAFGRERSTTSPSVNPDTHSGTLYGAWFADFLDVPQADIFHAYVEKIFRNGVTAGCAGGNYCRDSSVTRAQMAVFLLKAKLGSALRPAGVHRHLRRRRLPFAFADWIEELFARAITGGLQREPHLLPRQPRHAAPRWRSSCSRPRSGSSYAPPNCTGLVFDRRALRGRPLRPVDRGPRRRGITGGCGGGNYCPGAANTRGQMAVFLVKTFSLP